MAFKVSVNSNCDDVFLAWNPGEDIAGCIGFAIERKLNGKPEVLENRVGFQDAAAPDPAPSTAYPFQRLAWTDHAVGQGDTVSYRITARVGTEGNLKDGPASDWTPPVTLTAQCGPDVQAFFNRGVVLSQFMSKIMKENHWTVGDIKPNIKQIDGKLRKFLSGELRVALLKMLDAAIADKSITLYAALFELNDQELLDRLVKLGDRLNIVLANGAVDKKGEDENEAARAALVAAKAKVKNRMSAPSFLGHNKYVVLCKNGKSQSVWTGSTNWQPTGLCTQANNAILIDNASLAQTYMDAWKRIADAGDKKPAMLTQANAIQPPQVHALKNKSFAFAQFTAVPKASANAAESLDMAELLDMIAGARESLLFAMFMPGTDIYNAAVARGKDIYVRGVANTFPKTSVPGSANDIVDVNLVDAGKQTPTFELRAVEPQGIAGGFSAWVEEVTRNQFRAIGHSIIHSKVLVIDANGKNPTIVTGSHNFSKTASSSNDENFVAICGNAALAKAYAVNIMGLYDHYRWRKYIYDCVKAHKQPWSHLSQDPDWLNKYRKSPSRQALLKMLGIA